MSFVAWENNPNGICEDAPCCGCCGPQGDGRFYPDEPPENDPYDDYMDEYYDDDEEEFDDGPGPEYYAAPECRE